MDKSKMPRFLAHPVDHACILSLISEYAVEAVLQISTKSFWNSSLPPLIWIWPSFACLRREPLVHCWHGPSRHVTSCRQH